MSAKPVAAALALLGLVAFSVALIATVPASLVSRSFKLDPRIPVSGTVWSGEAVLAGGERVSWRTDALGSVLSLSAVTNLSVTGALTQLSARMAMRGDSATLSNLSGVAGWEIVRAVLPQLEIDCDIALRFEDAIIVTGKMAASVSGRASSGPGTCKGSSDGKAFDVPAAVAVATIVGGASLIKITQASDPSALLADIALGASGDVKATVQPRALQLVPGANAAGSVIYEMRSP